MKLIRNLTIASLATVIAAYAAAQPTADVYKANCAPCHGAAGDGNTPAGKRFQVPSFSAEAVIKESDADLLALVKNGKGKMPAWHDKLSDGQMNDLLAYIHSLQKK